MTATISSEQIRDLRRRRAAGESMKSLAVGTGMPWQRLWILLHEGVAVERNGDMAKKAAKGHEAIFQGLAEAIEEHLDGTVNEDRVREIVDAAIADRVPRPIEVNLSDGRSVIIEDRVHRQFDDVLGLVNEGHHNILMVGPSGCGKTILAKHIAEALDIPFGFLSLSAGVTETHLFGRLLPQADGTWDYTPSQFVNVYENGGVFLLDEIDAADPNVLVAVNAALANGVMANPNGRIHKRHADCYILAAVNTWGQGGDLMYVGRNQLDAATVDRFVLATVFVEYDTALECDLAEATLGTTNGEALKVLQWVQNLRTSIKTHRLRRVASTRLVVHGAAAMKAGKSLDEVKARYFQNWSDDERMKVEAA